MEKKKKTFAHIFSLVVFGILLGVFAIFSYGLAVSMLWNWFIAPLGFINIGLSHGYGLALFTKLLTFEIKTEPKDKEKPNFFINMFVSVFYPIVAIGIGYFIHLAMIS